VQDTRDHTVCVCVLVAWVTWAELRGHQSQRQPAMCSAVVTPTGEGALGGLVFTDRFPSLPVVVKAREKQAGLWGVVTVCESARAALSLTLSWFLFSRESY